MMEVEDARRQRLAEHQDFSYCASMKETNVPAQYRDPAAVTPPRDMAELVTRLTDVFAHEEISVEYVQTLMAAYVSTAKDWKKFAKFDPHRYTRNLVDEGNGRFNLIVLCWNEAQGSGIHDHAGSHCFLKVLDGEVREELFSWPEGATPNDTPETQRLEKGQLEQAGSKVFSRDQCAYINDSIGLHRMENHSHSDKAVTLHLYSPPFMECQCFDQRTGRASNSKMTFWSKYGKRTPFGKTGKTPQASSDSTRTADNN